MGCAESKQDTNFPPLLPLSFSNDDDDDDADITEFILMQPRMGQPQAPPAATPQLSTQHERLIVELLSFKDIRQLQE